MKAIEIQKLIDALAEENKQLEAEKKIIKEKRNQVPILDDDRIEGIDLVSQFLSDCYKNIYKLCYEDIYIKDYEWDGCTPTGPYSVIQAHVDETLHAITEIEKRTNKQRESYINTIKIEKYDSMYKPYDEQIKAIDDKINTNNERISDRRFELYFDSEDLPFDSEKVLQLVSVINSSRDFRVDKTGVISAQMNLHFEETINVDLEDKIDDIENVDDLYPDNKIQDITNGIVAKLKDIDKEVEITYSYEYETSDFKGDMEFYDYDYDHETKYYVGECKATHDVIVKFDLCKKK